MTTPSIRQVPRFHILTCGTPQKVSDGSSSYVSYLITSQVSPDERADQVRRRFSDFVKLYDQLLLEFPPVAVPPLPDRWRLEYIAGDRFSTEFTSKRAVSLERFLFRVSQHPDLRKSKTFKQFLSVGGALPIESDQYTMKTLDNLGEALMNAFTKAKHQSKDMIEAKERCERYEQNITNIDKSVVRTSKAQQDLVCDLEELAKSSTKLAEMDSETFKGLSVASQLIASETRLLKVNIDAKFSSALRDMSHYVQSLKNVLKQREQRQIDYEALVEYQNRTVHELVSAEHGQQVPTLSSSFFKSKINELRGVDREQLRQHRIEKLKVKVEEFKAESERAHEVSQSFEELAKREVRVFDQTEAIELQQSLKGLSEGYIEYYEGVLQRCKEVLKMCE